jgi:carbon-monoxide dehydrogenase medium subunit
MKPAAFEYLAPDSLEAALEAVAQNGDEAKLLAGGQSLIPAMNFRLLQPSLLIDLNRLSGLEAIAVQEDGELHIGAMARQRQMETSSLVAETAPLLAEAIPFIAHPQIRNRGTLGGSLVHADPAAELPVVALACEARMRLQSQSGERWVPAADFFLGLFTVDLQPDEILVEIAFPPLAAHTGWAFVEIARRRGDYAMLGVAAILSLDEQGNCAQVRLVYLNAGDGPVSAPRAASSLTGLPAGSQAFEAAAALASEEEIDPFGNVHATPEYQRHLARVLTIRALENAHQRARQR